MSELFQIRKIEKTDDRAVESIIRSVMPQFGASGPGFAIHDPEVGAMFSAYQIPRAVYFVALFEGRVVGGGGVAQLEGGNADTCELRKMYFLPEARGKGWGQKLLTLCLQSAREFKFRQCYLETLEKMNQARKLYERNGFEKLCAPMGGTGHFSCDSWYLKKL